LANHNIGNSSRAHPAHISFALERLEKDTRQTNKPEKEVLLWNIS